MAEFVMSPPEAIDLANQIMTNAAQLEELLKQLDKAVRDLEQDWAGVAATKFYNYYADAQPGLHSFPSMAESVATIAQQVAIAADVADDDVMK